MNSCPPTLREIQSLSLDFIFFENLTKSATFARVPLGVSQVIIQILLLFHTHAQKFWEED